MHSLMQQTSLRPNPGLGIWNWNQGPILVSELEPKLFLQKRGYSLYLSKLDFCKIPVWNIEFDFWSLSNWNFAAYTGSKYQVQTRQKIKSIKLDTYFKLEFCKNQVQIDRGSISFGICSKVLAISSFGIRYGRNQKPGFGHWLQAT